MATIIKNCVETTEQYNNVKPPHSNPTTNYPKDTHKDFCRRCLSHNNGCPSNHGGNPSKKCSL